MMADDPSEFLQRFNRDRSEAAFRELVRHHSPMVHATALRRLNGDRSAAQDVMQEVFTLLVRKAADLEGAQLSAWLYRQTCRQAINHIRSESRRRKRELLSSEAMKDSASPGEADREHLSRELDSALLTLRASDRNALVLRYLEDRDFGAVASALGLSEVAARKRVSRALEKLAAVLKRRGIATGSALLGSTMSGMGQVAPPDATVAKISLQAMKSLPAAGWSSFSGLLKPGLAGAALASLIAGGLLLRPTPAPAPSSSAITPAPPPRSSELAYLLRPVKAESIEDIIAEIKRTKAGPSHSLVTLRLKAILDRIPAKEIPAFIELAQKRLSPAEQDACFQPLLNRFLDHDPEAAMALLLSKRPAEDSGRTSSTSSTSLLGKVFDRWLDKDPAGLDAWLRQHWRDEGMERSLWSGTVRTSFATRIADRYLLDSGARQALDFLRTFPDAESRSKGLLGIAGGDGYCHGWFNISAERLLEFHRGLAQYPDTALAAEARLHLWENLIRSEPEKVEVMLAAMNPRERFEASLAKTGHYGKLASRTETADGGITSRFEQVKDPAQGEADSMAAGLAAGLSRQEIMERIGSALVWKRDPAIAVPWLMKHRGEVEIDSVLTEVIARHAASQPGRPTILWASCLSDPQLRLSLSRASFRLMMAHPGNEELKLLSDPDIPEDLRAEFRKIQATKP